MDVRQSINSAFSIVGRHNNENEENLECGICLDTYLFPVKLRCSHVFCMFCIKEVENQKCPFCRADYSLQDIGYVDGPYEDMVIRRVGRHNYAQQCDRLMNSQSHQHVIPVNRIRFASPLHINPPRINQPRRSARLANRNRHQRFQMDQHNNHHEPIVVNLPRRREQLNFLERTRNRITGAYDVLRNDIGNVWNLIYNRKELIILLILLYSLFLPQYVIEKLLTNDGTVFSAELISVNNGVVTLVKEIIINLIYAIVYWMFLLKVQNLQLNQERMKMLTEALTIPYMLSVAYFNVFYMLGLWQLVTAYSLAYQISLRRVCSKVKSFFTV